MADELLEMKQLQLGDVDIVDLEVKRRLVEAYANAVSATADRDVLHGGRHRRAGDSLALPSQKSTTQTVKILKIATSASFAATETFWSSLKPLRSSSSES